MLVFSQLLYIALRTFLKKATMHIKSLFRLQMSFAFLRRITFHLKDIFLKITIRFLELISTLGFPIACVVALGIFVWKVYNQSVAREDKLMAEITENRLVNEKAIETIAQFAERFTHIENDVELIKNDIVVIKEKL